MPVSNTKRCFVPPHSCYLRGFGGNTSLEQQRVALNLSATRPIEKLHGLKVSVLAPPDGWDTVSGTFVALGIGSVSTR